MQFVKIRNILLQLLILLAIYLAVQYWQTRSTLSGAATDIQATTLDGESISLHSLRGKPLLVHFWASWCAICRFEQDSINAIAKDYQVISVASHSGDIAAVQTYVKENLITAPVIVDAEGAWATLYGVRGFPTSFIIDKYGDIYDVEVGYSSEYGLRMRLWLAKIFS